jgi:glycosyltransferase involved in cell wall biosynthesis
MKQMNILVLCSAFPPNPGVGGRRWVKFSKYLNRLGHSVKAMTKQKQSHTSSEFQEDAKDIPILFYKTNAPSYSSGNCKNLAEKIGYRLWLLGNKWFYQGNIYDSSIRDKKNITRILKDCLAEVDMLIVTGAPFHLCYHGIKFTKENFPHIKCVLDIRDPWTSGTQFGMKLLNEKLLDEERNIENETIQLADLVLTPHDHIKKDYQTKHSTKEIHLINNGFDSEDFSSVNNYKVVEEKIVVCYGGSLYYSKVEIVNFFKASSKLTPDKKVTVNIYNPEERCRITSDNLTIDFMEYLDVKTFNEKLSESDVLLQFRPFPYQDWWSSKTAEIFMHKKPILNFGPEGSIAKIIKNDFGTSIEHIQSESIDLVELSTMKIESQIPDVICEMDIKIITDTLNEILTEKINLNQIA